jgi:hypothetical protein
MGRLVQQAHRESRELPDQLVQQVPRDYKVLRAVQETMVQLALQDHREFRELPDQLEPREYRVPLVQQELLVLQEQPELKVLRDLQE